MKQATPTFTYMFSKLMSLSRPVSLVVRPIKWSTCMQSSFVRQNNDLKNFDFLQADAYEI